LRGCRSVQCSYAVDGETIDFGFGCSSCYSRSGFYLHTNCKEMRLHLICRDIQKAKDQLETNSGVNLDHYHCLKSSQKKRKARKEKVKEEIAKLYKRTKLGL
jgi:hypothetical protein